MLHVLECFFNLKAVVINLDDFVPATIQVVGRDVPGLTSAPTHDA
jgi:hypothetical protein